MTVDSPRHIESSDRVISMDQFRGYTIVAMILVNYLHGFHAIHSVFHHNDTYLSFADTVMPGFQFIAGFSFRLTMLRRLKRSTWSSTCWSYIRRSLALVFVSTLLFTVIGTIFSSGEPDKSPEVSLSVKIAQYLKSDMWETLSIIGVTQLVILPLVPRTFRERVIAMIAFALGHAALCYWFNWGFVRGYPDNWMVQLWNTGKSGSWDGGFFGPLCWAVPMLGGTLAYDIIAECSTRRVAIRRLMQFGLVMTLAGYLISCGTRLYDIEEGKVEPPRLSTDWKRAKSPFIPSLANLDFRRPLSLLSEPPFVAPPSPYFRVENYWMMCKKIPTLSFMLTATGIAFLAYAGFVWLCDIRGIQFGVFRTFGTNPLLAYCLNELTYPLIKRLTAPDDPIWLCLLGFYACVGTVYVYLHVLERNKLFVRL